MANYTANYNLTKPLSTEFYNINDFNGNADKIDAAILAEKAATWAWAGDTFSNPNLLMNTNFLNPVNQRGQANYANPATNKLFAFDRWFITRASINLSANGVTLSPTDASLYGILGIFIEENYSGRVVTLSAKVNGVIYAASGALNATPENMQVSIPSGLVRAFMVSGFTYVEFNVGANTSPILIEWVKLELGSVATPFVPRPYAEELALCQRYYYKSAAEIYNPLAIGFVNTATGANFLFELPTTMRIAPTLLSNGTFFVFSANVLYAVSAIDILHSSQNKVLFSATSAGMTAGFGGSLQNYSDGSFLAFDAEL